MKMIVTGIRDWLLVSLFFVPLMSTCNIPSDLWCDSADAAQRCGVTQQCDMMRRSLAGRPIKITLMYEALCPFCQRFITNHLGNIFHQFRPHIELELIPWGNSRLLRDGSVSCNHGIRECDANRLQGCVLDAAPMRQALPFIICFERALHTQHIEGAIHHCSAFVRDQYRAIRHCYDSERGHQLQRQAAQRTMAARPQPIVEVPYVLINDYSPRTSVNTVITHALSQLLQKWTKQYY